MTWLDLAHLYVHAAALTIGPVLGGVIYALAWIAGTPR
jgi:hypothetical protein